MARTAQAETVPMRDYTIVLRAVSTTMRATDMLYVAASLLTSGSNAQGRAVNGAIVEMTARLLDLPTTEPELVERVLRNLPDTERQD